MQRLAFLWAVLMSGALSAAQLEFEACELSSPNSPTTINAQCTSFKVPEARGYSNSRTVQLAFARHRSRAPKAQPDPIVLLAGGPGQGAREAYVALASALRDLRADRDIWLLDQRGTGGSNRLDCALPEDLSTLDSTNVAAWGELALNCRDALLERADIRFYGTREAVADLDALRIAMGVDQLNLIGISYGTRVALEYLRAHPQNVRTVVLDGVVPPDLALGQDHARNLDAALEQIYAGCAADAQCQSRFPDPKLAFQRLRERLRVAPQRVEFADPRTGEARVEQLTESVLVGVIRIYAYVPEAAALLPLLIAEAEAGRPEALVAQTYMGLRSVAESVAYGMQLSVMCTEDAHRLRVDAKDLETVLGTTLVELTLAQCGNWPAGQAPDDYTKPVSTSHPVLLLSGERDPVTPPRYGEQAAKHLPNALHVIAPGQGHNVLPRGCLPRLIDQFIDRGTTAELNTECVDALGPMPFFLSPTGPQP